MNYRQKINMIKERGEVDLENLSFEELQEVAKKTAELARRSFRETGNRFQNINGDKIMIGEENGKYKVFGISDNLKDFHYYILLTANIKMQEGFNSKEELMQKIREIIKETENRIIE